MQVGKKRVSWADGGLRETGRQSGVGRLYVCPSVSWEDAVMV